MVRKTISHYKILSELGQGGMGVVYKAEDTKLRRTVALKFLRSDLIEDPEHRERFLREAQAAAALDHPNICTVYEIDEVDGQTFIAMACLEGQTIKDKLKDRPLKLDEALDIAIQTATGLQAAHEKGVVHRDIKGANLMVTAEGQVKIMDFGLAQLAERSQLTKTATILGTPAYMSPEQAQRLPTDRRTDIWSLGVVIYEMVTGRLPFEGERQQAVLYAIASEEPEPITALRAGLPMDLEWIVGKALAKAPEERYQHVEEMIVDLRVLRNKLITGKPKIMSRTRSQHTVSLAADTLAVPQRRYRIMQVLFAFSALVAIILTLTYLRETPDPIRVPLRRFVVDTPEELVTRNFQASAAISPNGRHVAFITAMDGGKLWVQDLDELQPRQIEGTEGARFPFWSPGSDFIGFFAGGELNKVPVTAGLVIRLCEAPRRARGGAWFSDGETIVFSTFGAPWLYRVSARGGVPSAVFEQEEIDSTPARIHPHFLPSKAGDSVLLYVEPTSGPEQRMIAEDLESGRRVDLGPGFFPVYAPSGHVLYQESVTSPNLWALPFSLEAFEATREPFPILVNARGPSIASDGTLVYVPSFKGRQKAVWVNREDQEKEDTGLVAESILNPMLSPDGRRLAFVSMPEYGTREVWVYDLSRGSRTLLSRSAEGLLSPIIWSPDGEQVAFSTHRARNWDILARQADASGNERVILKTEQNEIVSDWSRDGKYLLYHTVSSGFETDADLWYLERKEDGSGWEPHPFLQTPFEEQAAMLSPDGRYVAYVSNESGQNEVYVRPFPEGEGKSTVSSNGGRQPRWSRDGKELLYVEGNTFVAVSVSTSPSFAVGSATPLFELPGLTNNASARYSISADGQRFVVAEFVGLETEAPGPSIHVVENWYEEFRGREQD